MFVRLFADEQLDRTVPISKQPKERIQTIIDSCSRQFPEFGDRARKRLRTYLKACRRHKKTKELAGGEVSSFSRISRSTPAHLTSAQAELILAQACQNETRSAKWQHLGPEPACQLDFTEQLPPGTSVDPVAAEVTSCPPVAAADQVFCREVLQPATSALYQADVGQLLRHLLSSRAGGPPPPPTSRTTGELFFRHAPQSPLSAAEAAAVRQLVDSYRQSASLLRRTADELETLVPQANL